MSRLHHILILSIITVLVLGAAIASLISGRPSQAFASIALPPECAGMPVTAVITVTTSPAYIQTGGVLLVYGRPNLPNNVSIPWASQVCYVGGTAQDIVTGGRGNDILIGNGSTSTRDQLNGAGGSNVCYGTTGTVFANCSTISLQ